MKPQMVGKSWAALLLATSIAAGSAHGAGGNPLAFGKPDFEFTGTGLRQRDRSSPSKAHTWWPSTGSRWSAWRP